MDHFYVRLVLLLFASTVVGDVCQEPQYVAMVPLGLWPSATDFCNSHAGLYPCVETSTVFDEATVTETISTITINDNTASTPPATSTSISSSPLAAASQLCITKPNHPLGATCGVQGYVGEVHGFIIDLVTSDTFTPSGCATACAQREGCVSFLLGNQDTKFCELYSQGISEQGFGSDGGSFYAAYDMSCFLCPSSAATPPPLPSPTAEATPCVTITPGAVPTICEDGSYYQIMNNYGIFYVQQLCQRLLDGTILTGGEYSRQVCFNDFVGLTLDSQQGMANGWDSSGLCWVYQEDTVTWTEYGMGDQDIVAIVPEPNICDDSSSDTTGYQTFAAAKRTLGAIVESDVFPTGLPNLLGLLKNQRFEFQTTACSCMQGIIPCETMTETVTATQTESVIATSYVQGSAPIGTDDSGPTGTDEPTPMGTGDSKPIGTDDSGPTGTGEPIPIGTDESGPTETDDYSGSIETGEPGPTGTDEPGPTGTDEPGPTETGVCQYPPAAVTSPFAGNYCEEGRSTFAIKIDDCSNPFNGQYAQIGDGQGAESGSQVIYFDGAHSGNPSSFFFASGIDGEEGWLANAYNGLIFTIDSAYDDGQWLRYPGPPTDDFSLWCRYDLFTQLGCYNIYDSSTNSLAVCWEQGDVYGLAIGRAGSSNWDNFAAEGVCYRVAMLSIVPTCQQHIYR